MQYDVDYEHEFEEDEFGTPIMPSNVKWRENLCVLPNGRYLPPGHYRTSDDGDIIYEPKELSPFADLLEQLKQASSFRSSADCSRLGGLAETIQVGGLHQGYSNASEGFFKVPDLSFDEYRNQDVIETNDGAFFDALDEMFGIVPRTDELAYQDEEAESRYSD